MILKTAIQIWFAVFSYVVSLTEKWQILILKVRFVLYKKRRNEEMKMGVLSNLEPKKVFYYFEEITKIPHGSGNVEQISNFLVDFAKAHKLSIYRML